jgi:FkbM family methyltransferase
MTTLATRFLNRVLARARKGRDNHAAAESALFSYVNSDRLFPAERLLRLGTVYGGWVIPKDSGLGPDSVCYSAGAGEDISFDCGLAERFHCHVRIIDPTPRAIEHFRKLREAVISGSPFPINNSNTDYYSIAPKNFDKLAFLPIGLADQDKELKFFFPKNPAHVSCSTVNLQKTEEYFIARCSRLATIMKQMGDRAIDLLKMDIEGGEYMVISDLVTTGELPRILLVEFDEVHTPLDADAGVRIQRHIKMLEQAGMNCVAVESSNATFVRSEAFSK